MLQITISKRAAFMVLLAVVLVIPVVALAGAVFDDVSDGSTHIDGITFMKTSGVSVGCDALNNYCPSDNVRRDQMGTFMYRLSGNDPATAPSVNADKLDGIDSTGFLGVAAKAADSDLLDGIDSTGFLGATAKAADSDLLDGLTGEDYLTDDPIIIIEGAGWVFNAGIGNGSSIDQYTDLIRLVATSGSAYYAQLNLTVPSAIGGDAWGLKSVEICYKISDGFVDWTRIYDNPVVTTKVWIDDGTDRASTARTCYTIASTLPIAIGSYASLTLRVDPVAGGDLLDIYSVRTTWESASVFAPLGSDSHVQVDTLGSAE